MTDEDFMVYFDMDLDTDTVEGRQKKLLDWENWKQIHNRQRRLPPDNTRKACLICKKLYASNYLRKHVSSATHLKKEQEYFQLQMD